VTISRERLAAYADGELDGDEARAVEAEIAADPVLRDQLDAHRALRQRLAARFAPIAEQPVPDRLVDVLMRDRSQTNVVDLPTPAAKRRTPRPRAYWPRIAVPALAASVVVALIGIRAWTSRGYADAALAQALDRQVVALQSAQAPVRVLLSFRDGEGDYCRGFARDGRSGIACRDSRGWRLRKVFEGSRRGSTEYRQAGSDDAAVMAAIQDMAAGPALDAAAEAEAVRRGWRR
jgi:hypothetical protein